MENDNTRKIVTQGLIFNKYNGVVSVLITKRGPGARHNNYKWCIPGGHLDNDETLEECVSREVEEETSIITEPAAWNLYNIISDPKEPVIGITYFQTNNYIITNYNRNYANHIANTENPEVLEAKFVPIDELKNYDFAFDSYAKIMEVYEYVKFIEPGRFVEY